MKGLLDQVDAALPTLQSDANLRLMLIVPLASAIRAPALLASRRRSSDC